MQTRRRPAQVLALPEPLQQPQLGGPVQQVRAFHRVALEQIKHLGPHLEHLVGLGIRVTRGHQLGHPVQVNALQCKPGQLPAVGKRDGGPQRGVATDHVHRMDRAGQCQIRQVRTGLDQVEHQ
ncbi:Uncharacterised protein [Mycobacteroides abscessus subsp. massiliense]|nr:Uncharacterised protein [Mycobacteroides abscessus subsp. massiliense]